MSGDIFPAPSSSGLADKADDQGPDRPSRHGAILGRALARMEAAGRAVNPDIPDCCSTCGLREGTLANMTPGTGIMALNCVLGIDTDRFACHHGMRDGWPTKLCAGYVAAKAAPWETVKAILFDLKAELDGMTGADPIRADFDAWWAEADPERRLDIYQLSRLFERRRGSSEPLKAAHGTAREVNSNNQTIRAALAAAEGDVA